MEDKENPRGGVAERAKKAMDESIEGEGALHIRYGNAQGIPGKSVQGGLLRKSTGAVRKYPLRESRKEGLASDRKDS